MPGGRSGLSTNEEAAWFDKELADDEIEPPREMSRRRLFLLVSGTSVVALVVMMALVFAPAHRASARSKPDDSLAATPLATRSAIGAEPVVGSTPQPAAAPPSRSAKPANALPAAKKPADRPVPKPAPKLVPVKRATLPASNTKAATSKASAKNATKTQKMPAKKPALLPKRRSASPRKP